ncbi:MAG TPA: serine/threonine-protein kinase, partial [Pyrinomonadaceae bacterium]|nr:serine/threonine-protein kinase [Pyrinomonadaceae bacterium]
MRELSLENCRIDGRYDVICRLGRGSYAEVFLAEDRLASLASFHKKVVIKALNVFLQDDLDHDLERTLVENFENEAIALDRVRHPNVVCRLGHGTARDLEGALFHYIVLEYLEGGDLWQLVKTKPISLEKALFYFEQIAAGLSHAHRCGVIHRDIKPQNLLLSKDHQVVKIADFGVARIRQTDSIITRVGTNVFAPPEHTPLFASSGPGNQLSPASDIYSLAKTFYAILTSQPPRIFTCKQITALPEGLEDKPWSGRLLDILQKATEDEPEKRYQTIDEFW